MPTMHKQNKHFIADESDPNNPTHVMSDYVSTDRRLLATVVISLDPNITTDGRKYHTAVGYANNGKYQIFRKATLQEMSDVIVHWLDHL
jgi:hypothetical protein